MQMLIDDEPPAASPFYTLYAEAAILAKTTRGLTKSINNPQSTPVPIARQVESEQSVVEVGGPQSGVNFQDDSRRSSAQTASFQSVNSESRQSSFKSTITEQPDMNAFFQSMGADAQQRRTMPVTQQIVDSRQRQWSMPMQQAILAN